MPMRLLLRNYYRIRLDCIVLYFTILLRLFSCVQVVVCVNSRMKIVVGFFFFSKVAPSSRRCCLDFIFLWPTLKMRKSAMPHEISRSDVTIESIPCW
jgi:hypothetical protein